MGKMLKSRQHSDQEKINHILHGKPDSEECDADGIRFPAQAMFLINSFLAFVIVYANKVVLSVAIVAMYQEVSFNSTNAMNNSSIMNSITNETPETLHLLPMQIPPIPVSKFTKSRILGSFFTGYIVSQVPAGRLAERFGAKWLLGISLLLCSIISFLMPTAALHENDWLASPDSCWGSFYAFWHRLLGPAAGVQVLRSMQGLCTGVAHPCMHALITRWTPRTQRSMTTAFIYSGSQIGTVFVMPLTGYLASSTFMGGWPCVYYLLGVFGTVWFVCWVAFVYDTPDKHPFIHQKDLSKLKLGIGQETSHNNKNIPWKSVLTSLPVLALTLTHFGQNFGYFMLLTQLPSYLEKTLHYDIKQNGVISSLPYMTQAVTSWLASYASDRVVRTDKFSLSKVRKTFNSIGFFFPAVCFLVIAFFGQSALIVIISLILALGFNGFAMSGFHVTHVDMAPDFAGTLMGITNGLSNFNGVIAPEIVAALTDENHVTKWNLVFMIATAVYIITGLIFCFFATSKLQSWAVKQPSPTEVVVINGTNGGLNGTANRVSKCNGSCQNEKSNKNGVMNGFDQICCQLSQNYNNLLKSSNNFTVFDRKVASMNSRSLVAMCPSKMNTISQHESSNQYDNTAFNGDNQTNNSTAARNNKI